MSDKPATPKPPRIAYSPSEFADMVGLSSWAVRKLLRNNAIPATKFGQQWRISATYVEQVRAGEIDLPETRSA